MNDIVIVIKDIIGLFNLTDPTLPPHHNELIPVIKILAYIYDLILTLLGK